MNAYLLVKTLHILSSVLLVGTGLDRVLSDGRKAGAVLAQRRLGRFPRLTVPLFLRAIDFG